MRSNPIHDSEWSGHGAPLDDAAMQQHIRTLALTLNPDGESPLRFCSREALRMPLSAAHSLSSGEVLPCTSLEWLIENGRMAESLLLSLRPSGRTALPAGGGVPRIQCLARELVRHGDGHVTRERLTDCLIAFDEVRSLTMAEIQTAPDALAAALCEEYLLLASVAVESQKARLAAMRWLEEGAALSPGLARRSSAFFECALFELRQRDLSVRCGELAAWLRAHDQEPERLITLEHERQAHIRLFLGNLLSSLRMLAALDWTESFRRISRTEQTLLADPSGVYPQMDDESRAQVRRRVSYLAKACLMGEATIARLALEAANSGEGISRNICWWLYTDAGSRNLLEKNHIRARIRPLIPDPKGRLYLTGVLASALIFLLIALPVLGPAAALIALPILWGASASAVNRLIPRLVRPRPLLKMKFNSIPDEYRTLVVIPALLSSPDRAQALVGELEALGCLESDNNLSFLLLGDLPDHSEPRRDDDAEIIRAAEDAAAAANQRGGREKYFFLCRERSHQKCEGRYMGRERKRGALTDLHHLLLRGENAFGKPSALRLAHRFAFILTLDAGTRMLPGTLHKMIGTLAHPLNRLHHDPDGQPAGYSILAPRMELPADAVTGRFIELIAGRGGLDSYPTAVSDVYQDFCGQGTFGGKGIYDIAAFDEALSGKLPDNLILSHDLIEGLLSRAGFLCDITLYDGHPRTVRAFLLRLNRWTRGDWQLLPLLFRPTLRLRLLDKYRILDNLRRSLEPISQMALLYFGFYLRSPAVLAAALIPLILPLILYPSWTKDTVPRLLLRLALLPHEAAALLSGVVRSLWRMAVSHRHLLQWVTSDDADRRGGALAPFPGQAASALLLPALVAPAPWLLADVLLAALWWTGSAFLSSLEQPAEEDIPLPPAERAILHDLAERTFRFFADHTASTGLPPDNVQLDPDNGAANRTSPTNIGLYLVSCVAARELGIISFEELTRRAGETIASLERMEKWHGHIYNWIDTDTLAPLRPRYVSSVDSGNLAACLLLTARSLDREGASGPARRMEQLARGMDFTRLFDEKRRLFSIGMDIENDRLSSSHYDLLASESRILSFTAMMLHQIPVSHWSHLGRTAVPLGHSEALISWSGTMFEYLMPTLFMPVFSGTLLHQTQQAVLTAQMEQAPGSDMPWGVSESGFYSFDAALNYQYRAFGLPALALRGDADGSVAAPYASLLALPFAPEEVAENLKRMTELGLLGEYGLFEAADCAPERIPAGSDLRIVRSHMAHHQGMILCAVCNALTGFSLVRLFMDRPEARALSLLLQEKPAHRLRLTARKESTPPIAQVPAALTFSRIGRMGLQVPDTHLLTGPDTMALITADGTCFVRHGDILLNRRESDPAMPPEGFFIHAHDRSAGEHFLLSGARTPQKNTRLRVQFDAGSALFHTQTDRFDSQLRLLVSPEDGSFLQELTLQNLTDSPIELDVTSCFRPVLAPEADFAAHPVFQDLFLESSLIGPGALCFRRRPRAAGQVDPLLIHAAAGAGSGSVSWETDLLRLTGRSRLMSEPASLPDTLTNYLGPVITPCSALRVRLNLPANGKRSLCFAAGLIREEEAASFAERHGSMKSSVRALELAGTQSRELIRYLGLTPAMHHALQRTAALLLFPRLHVHWLNAPPEEDFHREDLWSIGVSGDLPIIIGFAKTVCETEPIRELIRAHEFYRLSGVACDLVLIAGQESGYSRPVRDRLHALIAGSHLRASIGGRGGVHLPEADSLNERIKNTLISAASLVICGSYGPLLPQLRSSLSSVRPLCAPPAEIQPSLTLPVLHPLAAPNGFGGFTDAGYVIEKTPAPAPWCSILCNQEFGTLIDERGGGFIWYKNSRNGRLTPFDNDPTQSRAGDLLLIRTENNRLYAPVGQAGRITHCPGSSVFEGECSAFSWTETQFVDPGFPVKCHHLVLTAKEDITLRLHARIDFLMNVARTEGNLTALCFEKGILYARGQNHATGFACFDQLPTRFENGLLTTDISLCAHETRRIDLLIGAAKETKDIVPLLVRFRDEGGGEAALSKTQDYWQERLSRLTLNTPDPLMNRMVSTWLPYQTLCGRIRGRTGFYQSGGAFGFRDQLQDMLSLLWTDPKTVRQHIILCAGRQFESGDVQHWWHPGEGGVRTRISDDLLFLPYVAAEYIETTGDRQILDAIIPFLKDAPIPEDREDWYGTAELSSESASLHEHCLRSIRRALRLGKHGLLLMGTGDWNDGMNRVGHMGAGESVWLTEFAVVVLEKYAPLCSKEIQEEFREIFSRLREAIEQNAWDGRWYLRAYMDDGTPLGSSKTEGGCRIDSLAQSWAVLAGLSRERVKTAMNEVDGQLIDREHGLIRLLTPPFDGETYDPGYIRGYPPGIRENGGQYTHAACWVVAALAELGLADKAWEAFRMLMPYTHSDTEEKALLYRTEPYVVAADIASEEPHAGRGGWTWYTGAAGWLVRVAYRYLMGFEQRGEYAYLRALLPKEWEEAGLTLRVGSSSYTFTARRSCGSPLLDNKPMPPEGVRLTDDGKEHFAVFPPRTQADR